MPFRGRHFEDVIILFCVRWHLRYSLSYRALEEMMIERLWRWVERYAPILNQRLCRVINVDGHPAYPPVIADLKRAGELGRICRCFIKRQIAASFVTICRRGTESP